MYRHGHTGITDGETATRGISDLFLFTGLVGDRPPPLPLVYHLFLTQCPEWRGAQSELVEITDEARQWIKCICKAWIYAAGCKWTRESQAGDQLWLTVHSGSSPGLTFSTMWQQGKWNKKDEDGKQFPLPESQSLGRAESEIPCENVRVSKWGNLLQSPK